MLGGGKSEKEHAPVDHFGKTHSFPCGSDSQAPQFGQDRISAEIVLLSWMGLDHPWDS